MTARTVLTAVLVVVLGALLGLSATVAHSSAAFTSASRTGQSTVRAAADWTPPKVTMTAPASTVTGTVTLSATATDAESGITGVEIQYQPAAGGTWETVCADTAAPYSCSWATAGVADGSYALRAVATDQAGYSAASSSVNTLVANTSTVFLADPGDALRGSVQLTATVVHSGTSTPAVSFEYIASGSTNGKWSTACTAPSGQYSCSWNTAGLTGDYDLRAVAVTGSTTTVSATRTEVLVDNTAPTVTMTDPGSPLSGTRTFAATAADAHSGIAQVELQYAPTGSSAYQQLCVVAEEPYSCRFDTTRLAGGTYSFRAVATDAVGNSTTSTAVTNRTVDNTVSSASLEDPGAYLSGIQTLRAVANSTAGISSVQIQYAPTKGATFTTICTDTTAPYSCDWSTASVADGTYDLRAVLKDTQNRETVSAVVAARQVDNAPLRGADVQTANGGTTVGRLDARDTITYTYTGQIAPASVIPGWDGAQATSVVVTLNGTSTGSVLTVGRTAGAVSNLGSVNLRQTYIRSGRTATFNATMTTSTVVVNGVTRSTVTVTLGAAISGAGSLRTTSTGAAMVWTPSAAVVDLAGKPASTSPVTETGVLDREF
ncbi:signal peptidase I [Kocuria sediminis]|uniref:Signal peptidase I n=1 Tax=Kocuria sediminis TaxID=1038857 RepID=A0A6N8GMI9_9MICC|nr:Ig-like domain-containing protein [Kocuria sediminis]MUN63477.1 signal peptidase I [Kocuria sediminis]